MKRVFLVSILFSFSAGIFAASLTISVKLPDGKPAKGVSISMAQLENPEPYSKLAGKTNKNGNLRITFQDAAINQASAGHGVYRFIIMPKSFKWEVSDYYCWAGSSTEPAYLPANPLNTGAVSKGLDAADYLTWAVKLSKGKDAKIQIINPDNKPVTGCKLGIGLDLHARSKSGLGAGITVTITAVDKSGSYLFKNAAELSYTLVMNGCGYYVPGLDYEVNYVEMPLKDGLNMIKFKKPERKEMTIRVRDFDTKEPLKGALVCEERKAKPVDRGGCFGKTNARGVFYTDEYNPEHVSKFGVTMDGYNEEWLDGDSLTDGGNYEFELKKKE
jgi:5-hydroxyisourate hydrolase-like protein (transthyretin family)